MRGPLTGCVGLSARWRGWSSRRGTRRGRARHRSLRWLRSRTAHAAPTTGDPRRRPRRAAGRPRRDRRDRPPRRAVERPPGPVRRGAHVCDQPPRRRPPREACTDGRRRALRLRVVVQHVRSLELRGPRRRDRTAGAADSVRGVEGAVRGVDLEVGRRRFLTGLPALRDRVRRVAQAPPRHRADTLSAPPSPPGRSGCRATGRPGGR